MLKRLFCLSILIFSLNFSLCFAASPGINLINDPASANWVPDSAVKNWMTIIPETPGGLARFNNISASNVIIRIHAAWTDVGQKMLDTDTNQTQVANEWCNVINPYSPGKTIYVEPFNELEQAYERISLSGNISVDAAIERANSFIGKLQSCLTNGTIISPALDPQNANFPKTSAAFSYFSIISYHPYREDTAKNYNSGSLTGKQFIFTEVGVDNGGVVYDDCEFIKFFCGKGITAFWQGQSDILAYTLFTFSPGNYAGNWRLTNPQVTKALKTDCSDTNCVTKTNVEHLLSRRWHYIPPVKLPDVAVQGIDTGDPLHSEVRSVSYANTLTENVFACSFTTNIDETIQPKNIAADGSEPQYVEQDITSIKEQKDNKSITNPGDANSSEQFGKDGIIDLNATPDDLKRQITQYGNSGRNTTVRVLPYSQLVVAKGELLKEASLSLNPDHKYDVIGTDEVLGYSCNGQWKVLFPKPTDPACRRVAISEVAWNFNKRGKPFLYELKDYGQIQSLPVSGDISAELSRFYDAGGYSGIWHKPFSPMSDSNYDKLYDMLPVVPRGSVNTKVLVKNTSKEEETKQKTKPLMAPISSSQVGTALKLLIPREQETLIRTKNGDMICKKVEKVGTVTVDEGSKLSFWAQIVAAVKKIFTTPETLSGTVETVLYLPESTVNNLKLGEAHLSNMIPSQDSQKYQFENVPNSSTEEFYPDTNNQGSVKLNYNSLLFLPYQSQKSFREDNL